MKEEEDIVVVSSDSEDDEDVVWMRKKQNKQYQMLSDKIKSIMYYQVQPGYKKPKRFPYEKFQEFANDLKKSLDLVHTNSTKAFIWTNLIRWLVSIKTCFENVSDCINDRCYNLILTDFMSQYVNYKCKLNSSITDEAAVSLITNDIILTLSLVFNGWVPGILMTLLKVEVIDEYKSILYPIFRKYLSIKHLHRSDDLISYLRLIFCFRKWKKLTHLKEDKEIINEIAVGKSLKALSSDVIDLSTETTDIPVLPKFVPAVNEDNRSFAKINGLIGFAIKNRENGTRILLINKTLELDEAIEQFFKLYSEYIHRGALKPALSTADIKPTVIEDLTRSTSPDQHLPGLSCAFRDNFENANKSKTNSYGKQGTKAVDQHLSINCDTSSISVFNNINNFNNSNLNSHKIENLSSSFKYNQENRNSEVVLSSNNNNNNYVLDLDETDDEDDNKPMSEYEKQVVQAIEKLKQRAIIVGEILDREITEKTSDAPVVVPISSNETRQSSDEVPIVPEVAGPAAASNILEVPIQNPNPDPISRSLNPPNSLPVEKHIRKRHGIVSSTTSFEGTGDDSDNSDDYDGFGVHSRVLFSQRSFYKVVEEATSSTNEIPKTSSSVNSQPRRSISSSPCPTRPSSASPDRWSNFSPASTIRSGSSSRLGIIPGTSITTGRPLSCINDGELPTCSRYVAMTTTVATVTTKESATSMNVIESSASAPDISETNGEKNLQSIPEPENIKPKTKVTALNKSKDFEVNTQTCSVKELLKNITGFIGDIQEEYGFESSKNKCGPDKFPGDVSESPTIVENPTNDNESAEKTEAKSSQNAVEKDTNTNIENEVERQVKSSVDQQPNLLLELEIINHVKITKDTTNNIKVSSRQITIEENSITEVLKEKCDTERLTEKQDVGKPSEILNRSQSNSDKDSNEEKEAAILENKEVLNLPVELGRMENELKLSNDKTEIKIDLMKENSNLNQKETVVEITKNQVQEANLIADQDNVFESIEEDESSTDDIESPPYELICQNESIDTPVKNSDLDNKEEHISNDDFNKTSQQTIPSIENISAESGNSCSNQTVDKDFNRTNSQNEENIVEQDSEHISNDDFNKTLQQTIPSIENISAESGNSCSNQTVDKDFNRTNSQNEENIVEQDSEPNHTSFGVEDIISTNEVVETEKTSNNEIEVPPKNQIEANANIPKRDDAKLKINEIVKSDHDYVTVEYSYTSRNDLAFEELKELQSLTNSPIIGSMTDSASDFENSFKDTSCSDMEKERISCGDENETVNDYDQFFQVFTDPAFTTCISDNQGVTVRNQLPANQEFEDKESSNSVASEPTENCSIDQNKRFVDKINNFERIIEEKTQSKTSANENIDTESGCCATTVTELHILDQNETDNEDIIKSLEICSSENQSIDNIEKQSSLVKDNDTKHVEVTEKEDSSPENDRNDKLVYSETGDNTATKKDQPSIEQISFEHNIIATETELDSFDNREFVKQALSNTTDSNDADVDVDIINETQLPAEQIISEEFLIPNDTELNVNNLITNDEFKNESNIDGIKAIQELIETQNSDANEIEEDQSVIQDLISDQTTSLIDRDKEKKKENKDNIEHPKMCKQIEHSNKLIENQSSCIEDISERSTEKRSEIETKNKSEEINHNCETIDIQEIQKSHVCVDEITSDDNLSQHQKKTTTKGENQLDNICKKQQTEVQEIVASSLRVLDKPLQVLTTIEQCQAIEDVPKEKSQVLNQRTTVENINKFQALQSKELFNEIDDSPNKRKLIIRIARLPILEDELERGESSTKTETSEQQQIEEIKSIEDLREYQIPKDTSQKIEKRSRKRIKKAIKTQALQKLVIEKVDELIFVPIKDSKTPLAVQSLESISIHTENKVMNTEVNNKEDQDEKTEANIVSPNNSQSVMKDVKVVVPEVCDKTKPEKKSAKKNKENKKTTKKELKKKDKKSKSLQEEQSFELNVTKIVDREIKTKNLTENYDNQSNNDLDGKVDFVREHGDNKVLLNIDPITARKDHEIQKQMFNVNETKLAPQIDSINSPLIVQNETQRTFEDEDQSRTLQTTTHQATNDSQDQDKTNTVNENYLENKNPKESRKMSTSIANKIVQEACNKMLAVKHDQECENTVHINEFSCSTNIDSKIDSKTETKYPEDLTLVVKNSSIFHPKAVDVEQLVGENIQKEENQDILDTNSESPKINDEVHSSTTDESKRKLIIRIPKLLVSKEDLPKEEIPSASNNLTPEIQKQLTNSGEHGAEYTFSQETLAEKEVLKKKKLPKQKIKTIKAISTLRWNVLEEEVKESFIYSIPEEQDCKLEFSKTIDIQIKNQPKVIEREQHQKNKLTEKANENLESDAKTHKKVSPKKKPKCSETQGIVNKIQQIHNLKEHTDETLQVPTKDLKLSPEKQIPNLDASECLARKAFAIEHDFMICSSSSKTKNPKTKKTNKKSKTKTANKLNIPVKTVHLQETNNELIATKDLTLPPNHAKVDKPNAPVVNIPDEHRKMAAEDNVDNNGRSEKDKPKPKVTVDNVIGHKSFVKAILEEYMRKSLNDTTSSSTDIPNAKSLENDPKLTHIPTGESYKGKTNSLLEKASEKQIRNNDEIQFNKQAKETSTEESPLKKMKTTIEAHSLLKPIEESTKELANLQTIQVKVEILEDNCLPAVDIASVKSPSKDVKCAECQTEPKSTVGKYIQPCSSKCQTFSDVASTKHSKLGSDTLKTIVECKDDLIKNRNQEVFSQITCAKQQNSIEPDSSSQLATELQRTESTLTEEESNLSTRVQVADLGEPSVISDSEISQQNASVALESDKSIVFYPSRDSAEDQEVSSITSQTNDSSIIYYGYHDENGTPVMDEKNSTEEDSPSSQCKITSLSKIKVPTADVHEVTTLLLSKKTQLEEATSKTNSDGIESEPHPVSIDNAEKCEVRSDESTTQLWGGAPDENFELWLKKIGISKNCALKGKHVGKNLTKPSENTSDNQKNDRKQRKPQRVQKFEAYQADQKSFNFEDLNAAAVLASFKADRQKKNNRSRKGLQPTRITRSASQMVELAESILLHNSEQMIPSMSCSTKTLCEKDPLENLKISRMCSNTELLKPNSSSDSEDTEKLVIDLNAKKSTKSKVKKKQKPKQVQKEKAAAKKINKTVKKISFNPIVEVFEANSPDIFEGYRGRRTRSSKNLLIQSPQVTNTTKSRRGTPRKKSEQNKTENRILKTPIKKGKLRINFDFPVGNAEEHTFTEEQNNDGFTNTSTCTPHNMNQETWLKNLTLRKTSKSLDLEVKQIFDNVSKVKKVISEPDLLKAPKIDINFLQSKSKESANVLETLVCTNKTEKDKSNSKSKNDTHEGKEILPISTLKVSMKGIDAKKISTIEQVKGEKLKKCIRRLSMEMEINDKEKSSQQPKKSTKLTKKPALCEKPVAAVATPTFETLFVEDPKHTETFSKSKSSLETPKKSKIQQESHPVELLQINKIGQEKIIAKIEGFAAPEQAKSITDRSCLTDADKQAKLISKKGKKTKKRNAELNKSSNLLKKPKLKQTSFEDPIAPVTQDCHSVSKTDLTQEKVKEQKTAKVKEVEQAKPVKKVSKTTVGEASLNEVKTKLKSTSEEENKLIEKVEVTSLIKHSKQKQKPEALIKEATSFVDPIIPVIPHSVSPSNASESDVTYLAHVTTKHSELELSSSAIAETKIEQDQTTATIEEAEPNEEESHTTTTSLDEVENQVKSISEEASKSTELVTNENSAAKESVEAKHLVKEPTPSENPIAPVRPHSDSPSETVQSALTQSSHETQKHLELELKSKTVTIDETESDKTEKGHETTKIDKVAIIQQAESIPEVFDTEIEVKKEDNTISKETNKLTKSASDNIIDLDKTEKGHETKQIDKVAIIQHAESIPEVFDTEIEVKKEDNTISKETNKLTKSASDNIIDLAKSDGTTVIPSKVEQAKSFAEVFNTTVDVPEKHVELTTTNCSIADLVKSVDTTVISSEVLISNEEKGDVDVLSIDIYARETLNLDESVPTSDSSLTVEKDTKHLINSPQATKPSSSVKTTPTKKEDGLIRELDNSIINILSQLSNVNDNDSSSVIAKETTKQKSENSSAQSKNGNHLNTKPVETFAKRKHPSTDGVQNAVNDSVIRRRTSDVDGSELSFTNSLELERDYFYNPIDADNFSDQSRLHISIESDIQQPLSEIMFSGNRGQDDEDKLHMFNTYLAFEPVPTSSPNENDDNLNDFEELYSLLPTFALTNGPENVPGVNYESAEKTKTEIKKVDFIPKEVDTLKTTFEDENVSEVGKKQTIDASSSSSPEGILMNPSQSTTCSKIETTKFDLLKLYQRNTPDKKVSTDETPESILESKLKSRQKPFWKLMKTPTKTKVFPENLVEPRKLDSSTSLISLTDNPYTVDDVKSLPLYFDKIFEEKHTKPPPLSEKQVSPSLSSDVDDRFDRLKNEAPLNEIPKPVKSCSPTKDEDKTAMISFDTKTNDDTKTQSISKDSTIPPISTQLDEDKVDTNKPLPLNTNPLDHSILNSNKSHPLEETTASSSKDLEKTPTNLIESNIDENASHLKKPSEPIQSSSHMNETKVDIQSKPLSETTMEKPLVQSPIPVVQNSPQNSPQIKPTQKNKEEISEKKTSSKPLLCNTQPPILIVSPSIPTLLVIPTNLDSSSQKPTTLLAETKTSDAFDKLKTTPPTSENKVLLTNKPTLKQFPLCSDVKKEKPSQLFCSEISVTSPKVTVVPSIPSIPTTSVKPQTLDVKEQSTSHKASSSCKKPLEQPIVTKTPDPPKKVNETQPVSPNKTTVVASKLTIKRNSALIDDTKLQEPPSKILRTESLPAAAVSSIPPILASTTVTPVILNLCDRKIPVKVISSKKPVKQIPVNKITDQCVKINKNKNLEESKPSLKRCSSLKEAAKVQEPPAKIVRPEVSGMTMQHQVSHTPPNQLSTPKIPYCNLITSSPNVSKVNSPARSKTMIKLSSTSTPKSSSIRIASPSSTNQKLLEPILKQSVMLPSQCPKIPKIMTPVHTTEKPISITPFKTGTPSRTPGTVYMEKPKSTSTTRSNSEHLSTPRSTSSSSDISSSRTLNTSMSTTKSNNVYLSTPRSTSSSSDISDSRTLNTLSSELKKVSLDVEKIKNQLDSLPAINYTVHKQRKVLLAELENKQKLLDELKKKYQEYERYTRVLKAHSERKPIDRDHQPHHHNQHHRPNVQQSNDLKRKYDHSRPHSERQLSKFNTSGHSSHVEQHKERHHTYVNKFSELDKMNFTNKNYQSAQIKPEAKKLPPWDAKLPTADEIIRTLRRK